MLTAQCKADAPQQTRMFKAISVSDTQMMWQKIKAALLQLQPCPSTTGAEFCFSSPASHENIWGERRATLKGSRNHCTFHEEKGMAQHFCAALGCKEGAQLWHIQRKQLRQKREKLPGKELNRTGLVALILLTNLTGHSRALTWILRSDYPASSICSAPHQSHPSRALAPPAPSAAHGIFLL